MIATPSAWRPRCTDLDTLCTVVYCTADDLLPEPKRNARRRTTDAEIVTLCVAQAIMGIPSDRRFLRVAQDRLSPLFPEIPAQAAYFKRPARLAPLLQWFLVACPAKSRFHRYSSAHRLDPSGVRQKPKPSFGLRPFRTSRTTQVLRQSFRATSGEYACMPSSPPTASPSVFCHLSQAR